MTGAAAQLRARIAFVAHMLSTPLGDVLAMKLRDFEKWSAAADKVAAARPAFGA